ncbi:hypothetical protein ACFQH6_01990 [Halobacteriaceae archaeon GCM10025711]
MQSRAVAISVVVFLVLAAGSYALAGAAQEPTVSIDTAEYELSQGDTFAPGDIEYTVASVGDGQAKANWTNQSARFTETLDNDSTVTYQGTDYTVVIPNQSDPTTFQLREVQELGENQSTVEQDNTTYVVVDENGNKTLVPVDEYLPEPDVREFSEGDDFEYENQTTTVGDVAQDSVTLEWTATKDNQVTMRSGENVTLDGQTYTAYVTGSTIQLTSQFSDYQEDVDAQDYYQERLNGLYGVTILSLTAAALLIAVAFLSPRY